MFKISTAAEASAVVFGERASIFGGLGSFFAFVAKIDVIAKGSLFVALVGLFIQLSFWHNFLLQNFWLGCCGRGVNEQLQDKQRRDVKLIITNNLEIKRSCYDQHDWCSVQNTGGRCWVNIKSIKFGVDNLRHINNQLINSLNLLQLRQFWIPIFSVKVHI